jgi:membrane protein implicated in regulation of membrane protease activity
MERKSKMEHYKVGFLYDFHDDIEQYVHELNQGEYVHILNEYGQEYIGENFVVISNIDKDHCVSFMLVSVQGAKWMYKCIYSDYQKDGGK